MVGSCPLEKCNSNGLNSHESAYEAQRAGPMSAQGVAQRSPGDSVRKQRKPQRGGPSLPDCRIGFSILDCIVLQIPIKNPQR